MEYIQKNLKRLLLFAIGCIGTRVSIGMFIRYSKFNTNIMNILALILLSIGIGFLIIYFGGFRKKGIETDGNKIWWNYLRPFHGILYITSAILLFKNMRILSSNIILFDVLIGTFAWLFFHLKNSGL